MNIYIDSDAFIALNVKSDLHHANAKKIVNSLKKSDPQFSTSWEVIDEVTTKLSYGISKNSAIQFIDNINKMEIDIYYPTEELASETYKIFGMIKSKNISLTDCFNIAIMKIHEIDCIFSFDKIYKKQGLKMLAE